MRRLVMVAMILVAVAGCASQQPSKNAESSPPAGQFTSAEDLYWKAYTRDMAPRLDQQGVPSQLQHDFFACMWQVVWGRFTPEERAAMDDAARTKSGVPDESLKRNISREIDEVTGPDFEAILRAQCPDTVSAMKSYMH